MMLHAYADDWNLNALEDTPRSVGTSVLLPVYLTDPSGNRLTDTLGNYLIGYMSTALYPQLLNANPDDLILNAEST